VYSTGRYELETGILGNYSLLSSETVFMKVAHCLSKDKKKFKELFESNLEGFEFRNVDIETEF
jgi:hypothetical protein